MRSPHISTSTKSDPKEIEHLLARVPIVRSPCDLDLLVFLHRHPRALLTSEQLAGFVGYDIKAIATSLETFLGAGLLERTQNPKHAARMYLLVLDGPHHNGTRELLKLASTPSGRRAVLQVLDPARRGPGDKAQQGQRRLRIA